MNHKTPAPIPEAITQLRRRLEEFRSAQPVRTKLPESLWEGGGPVGSPARYLCRGHPLRLDYTRLKQRLGGDPSQRRKPELPAFVELIGSNAATLPKCVIEFESARGGKMHVQWKAAVPPDWASLLHAWHETQR